MRTTTLVRTVLLSVAATAALGAAATGTADAEQADPAPSYGPHLSDMPAVYGPVAPRRSAQASLMSPVSSDDLGRKFK